jgi:hypothetical protein
MPKLILSALALMLAGCATSPGKLSVDLRAPLMDCRRLEAPLKVPQITPDTDYRDLSSESLGTIAKGRRGQAARNRCEDDVIQKYETAK